MEHKIGLVFDGGGGKGAYQIGMWKALKELGLDKLVTDVAGTSVGGLNAALFCKGDLEDAEKIWLKEISTVDIPTIQMDVGKLINEHLENMAFFDTTPINCYITVHNSTYPNDLEKIEYKNGNIAKLCRGKAEYLNIRCLPSDERNNFFSSNIINKVWKLATEDFKELFKRSKQSTLLASSALPFFCLPVRMGDNIYSDGGRDDNSPIYALLAASKCDVIIVVHLEAERIIYPNQRKKFELNCELNPDIPVLEIFPSNDTGRFINGTVNFKSEHAKKLMELGYQDSIEPLRNLVKNWQKESGDYSKFINTELSQEDKYRLLNECNFLKQNQIAKVEYLSEDGFGKTIIRVLSGADRRVRRSVMKNDAKLHDKMMSILTCLDDEVYNIKVGMHYLYKDHNRLLTLYYLFLSLTGVIQDINTNMEQLAEHVGFEFNNNTDPKDALNILETMIRQEIDDINAKDKAMYEEETARLKALEDRKKQARKCKLLRITPDKVFEITQTGVTFTEPESKMGYTVSGKIKKRAMKNLVDDNNQFSALIIPEGADNLPPLAKLYIKPADYYMFLWFENTKVKDRAGCCVCFMDYYKSHIYVYGYKVDIEGKSYSQIYIQDNKISSTKKKDNIYHDLKKMFGESNYNDMLYFRTFESDWKTFNNKLKDIRLVDPVWENNLKKNKGELFVKLVDRFIDRQ